MNGCGHDVDYSSFEATTVSRSGSFELDMSPDAAFPLFTAPGEGAWAPGWNPFILNGDGYKKGTVWVTEGHGHTAYWYVENYDTVSRHARYVRVTPRADTGTVDVRVSENGDGSKITVVYHMTGLSEKGNENLESSFSESAYSEMMEHWRELIIDNREKIEKFSNR